MFVFRKPATSMLKMHQITQMRLFGCGGNNIKKDSVVDFEEPIKTTIFEEARIGENVHPAKFEKEKVMSNIDPETMLKKEQSLEYQELP